MELARNLAGLALFLFPGAAWALALARKAGWLKVALLSVLLAFTLAPAALFAMSLLFDAPIELGTMAFLAAALGALGLAVALAGPVRDALALES